MSDIIILNVGGTIFRSTKSTLEISKYFEAMLNGNFKLNKDEVFIDRDPELFGYILSYLRNKDINQFNKYYEKRSDLEGELQFYCLDIENNEIVTINVGGTIFKTTRSTLEPLLYFQNCMDNKNVNVFIDRDPELFGYILNYLRNSNLQQIYKYMRERKDLRKELKFYEFKSLDNLIVKIHEIKLKKEEIKQKKEKIKQKKEKKTEKMEKMEKMEKTEETKINVPDALGHYRTSVEDWLHYVSQDDTTKSFV